MADIDPQEAASSGVYVSCEKIEDEPIVILDFDFEPGYKDPNKEQVKISVQLETDLEDEFHLLSTQQSAILAQLHNANRNKLPFRGLMVTRVWDKPNQYGNYSYCLQPYISEPLPTVHTETHSKPVQRPLPRR